MVVGGAWDGWRGWKDKSWHSFGNIYLFKIFCFQSHCHLLPEIRKRTAVSCLWYLSLQVLPAEWSELFEWSCWQCDLSRLRSELSPPSSILVNPFAKVNSLWPTIHICFTNSLGEKIEHFVTTLRNTAEHLKTHVTCQQSLARLLREFLHLES